MNRSYVGIQDRLHLSTGSGSGVVHWGSAIVEGVVIAGTVLAGTILLTSDCAGLGWALNMKTKSSEIDVAMTPEEKGTETWLGEYVENAVEDGLRVGRDDVASFTETPCNWVQEPQRDGPDAAESIYFADVGTDGACVPPTLEDNGPSDEQESEAAEDKVSPFVRRLDERTDETSDDHYLVEEDGVNDGRCWETAGQEKVLRKGSVKACFL